MALTAAGAAIATKPAFATALAYDPRNTAEGQIKLNATLDGSPAFWFYNGIIYAVQPKLRPLPMVAITGCNSVWAQKLPDNSWRVSGAILTFFRDINTGAFLTQFKNPITGAMCNVQPNFLHGGSIIYPANGGSAYAQGQIKPSVIAPGGFKPAIAGQKLGTVRWSLLGGTILLMTDRSWNVPVQPQLEAQSITGDAAQFFNPKILHMPASVSTTTIAPWITWMNMAAVPGNLVWHVEGEKLLNSHDIPADYQTQAGKQMQILLNRPE